MEELQKWDRDIFIFLNSFGIEDYDAFWKTLTNFYTWTPLFLTIIFLIFWKNNRHEGLRMLLCLGLMILTVTLVIFLTKEGIGRLRPNNDMAINKLIRILQSPTGYSFFSGHAAASFSITTLLVLFLRKKMRWVSLFFVWPVLFSFSRIYLGVHYPSDILVGAMVGVLLALLFYWGYKKFSAPDLR